jgi:hypothetical protein
MGAALSACADSALASEPRVIVKTITTDAVAGRLVEFSLAKGLVLRTDDGTERDLPTRDLVRLSRSTGAGAVGPYGTKVEIVGGDILFGHLVDDGLEGALRLDTLEVGPLDVPLDVVTAFETSRELNPTQKGALESLDEDRVLLTNGDVLGGFITGVSSARIALDSALGEQEISAELVVAARLAAQRVEAIEGPHVLVHFRSGGRLTATDLRWAEDSIEARLRYGPRIQIKPERIEALDLIGGRWEWLGSHEPVSFQHTPMFSLDWPYRKNRNVLGRPLMIAGERFEHGLGVHSRSNLIYELRGGYREFVTSFGLDDSSGRHADVDVAVRVDDQTRFERRGVRAGELVGPIRINIAGASRIELIVDFGKNGDLQDRFNWVEAALVK